MRFVRSFSYASLPCLLHMAGRQNLDAVTKEFVIVNGRIQSILTTLRAEDPETAAYKKRLSS
jgi:hypothetical protein